MKNLAVVFLSAAAILAGTAPLFGQAGAKVDISGYWELTIDGKFVPPAKLSLKVTPAMLAAEAGKREKAIRWCNWVGMPTTMDVGRPLNIRQGAREVVIVAESPVTPVRHFYLDRKTHIDKEIFDPSTSGDSIAHWEGDTLVVDTTGFDPDQGHHGHSGRRLQDGGHTAGRALPSAEGWKHPLGQVHVDGSGRVSDATHLRVPLSAR